MAMFREHIAIGAIISMVVVVGVYFYALVTDPWLLLILFIVTTIGSFLPDVDSDSGMPFYLVFGTMTLAATGVVLLYTLNSAYAADWRYLAGIPLAALAFFWFVVGGALKKCTHHRGIFHSLPAMIIAGVATFLIAERFGLSDLVSLVYASAMAVGFASHLVLDEMHSFVDLEGIPFVPKKSLGTALKLFSDSNRVNMATYLLLAALVYTAYARVPVAEAYFYNDSDIIEIGDGVPKSVVPPSAGQGWYSPPPPDPVDEEDTEEVVVIASSTPTATVIADEGDTEDEDSVPITDTEAFDILLNDGAITGSGLVSKSEFFENALLAGFSFGIHEGSISIFGSRVRDALRGRYNLGDVLKSWRAGASGPLSARGYGLVAASTALRDSNVDMVTFSADSFALTYRSRGYLFVVIPISFPVRVTVMPQANERVVVKLPWYRFFVREFFTRESLAREIDAVMVEAAEKNTKPESDLKAVLFEAVAQFLQKKVGTITDTVSLGTK